MSYPEYNIYCHVYGAEQGIDLDQSLVGKKMLETHLMNDETHLMNDETHRVDDETCSVKDVMMTLVADPRV